MSNRDGNSEIYLKHGMDTTWINLTNIEAGDNWPSWSPDGKKILFQSSRSGNLDIWLMNKDGTDPIQLTDNTDHDYLPSFSPDGNQISFTSWRLEEGDEERTPHIYIMNRDGTGQRRLIQESLNTSAGASWHPGGTKFLYTRKTGEIGANIYEADNEGSFLRQVTDDTLYSGGAEYSPDGSRIIYTSDYGDYTEVVLADAEGNNPEILLSGEQNYYPHWSPDGEWIIFTKIIPDTDGKDLDIYAISVSDPMNQPLLISGPNREAEGRWK
ncbi:hypothetical protein G3570_02385 [Balneolaceae bacterium YR4-1]|uniref:DUF5050 domain-containing protein n=1 Tax=Halalkalibaculum roseum TaxID=2709311 RepID=A0A6M1SWN1_9BACT|nr:PD40 domain-containing protein [Halalkalibaculum roseum]NGP75464.1 hypothetical protein [Halalkalibaculum roseum]